MNEYLWSDRPAPSGEVYLGAKSGTRLKELSTSVSSADEVASDRDRPIPTEGEFRRYLRDPDGHLLEVGQTKQIGKAQ